jgi:hypothetical protein
VGGGTASNERRLRIGPWVRGRPAEGSKPRLMIGGSMILILLLSLAFWVAIWAGVSALTRALVP